MPSSGILLEGPLRKDALRAFEYLSPLGIVKKATVFANFCQKDTPDKTIFELRLTFETPLKKESTTTACRKAWFLRFSATEASKKHPRSPPYTGRGFHEACKRLQEASNTVKEASKRHPGGPPCDEALQNQNKQSI